jgi:hypothetical protein
MVPECIFFSVVIFVLDAPQWQDKNLQYSQKPHLYLVSGAPSPSFSDIYSGGFTDWESEL